MKGALLAFFVMIGLGTALVLRPPPSLRLREVILTSPPRRLSEQDLIRLSEIRQGENLLGVSLKGVRQKLLRYPWIRDVRLARTFPGRLQISVIEEEPMALLDLGDLYLINRDGEIFKKASAKDPKDLPLLTGFTRSDFEGDSDPLEEILPLLIHAQRMPIFEKIGISEIHRGPDGLSLFTVSPVMRLKLGAADWEKRLDRFDRASEVILGQPKRPFFVDLTYERRIFVKRRG